MARSPQLVEESLTQAAVAMGPEACAWHCANNSARVSVEELGGNGEMGGWIELRLKRPPTLSK